MLRIGSRAQVIHGNAKMTGGGLKKKDLKYNKQGKIVSKKMSSIAKKDKRLQKAGYTTKKGQFKLFKKQRGAASVLVDKHINTIVDINEYNHVSIWVGCYNSAYDPDSDLVEEIRKDNGYFEKYIEKLGEHNSCLIIVEPRIFGEYRESRIVSQEDREIKITSVMTAILRKLYPLTPIPIYLVNKIEDHDLLNKIKMYHNELFILNMNEYINGNSMSLDAKATQLPYVLINSLYTRKKNFEMCLSNEILGPLIAKNIIDLIIIKVIIGNYSEIRLQGGRCKVNDYKTLLRQEPTPRIKVHPPQSVTSFLSKIDSDSANNKIYKDIIKSSLTKSILLDNDNDDLFDMYGKIKDDKIKEGMREYTLYVMREYLFNNEDLKFKRNSPGIN
jgi:hypothetical protein